MILFGTSLWQDRWFSIFELHHSCVKSTVTSQTWALHMRCRYLSKIQAAVAASARPGTRMAARGSPPGSPSPPWPTGPFCGCNYKGEKIFMSESVTREPQFCVWTRWFRKSVQNSLLRYLQTPHIGWTELKCRMPSHYQAPSCFSATS